MDGPISTRRHGDVLIVLSNNPPVNALSTAVRQGLVDAIASAEQDVSVNAVVIACEGQTFFAGADISEFDKPPQEPLLPAVVEAIENCSKPVVAAIHGTALGGGLEVALGCHYRVADPSAKVGTPEVKLGLIPGAGGTQRLPRVAGVKRALEMVTSGTPIGAREGFDCGLIDRLFEGDLLPHAVAYAEEVRDVRPLPKASERQGKIDECDPSLFDEFRAANAKRFRGFDAPEAAMQAVQLACRGAYADGVAQERKLFLDLRAGIQSAAQRHIFFAERKAAKIDGLPEDTVPRTIAKVGVIGAGTMGGGIAMNFLSAGIPVTIVETGQDALDRGTGVMLRNYQASAARGKLTEQQVGHAMGLLNATLEFAALANCDLIIEAVYESMDLKKDVFARLDRIAKPGAILASNTSYLDLNEIAAATSRPADVVGLHFFSPANVMKLLEVVRGAATASDVLLTAMNLGKRIGKVPVVAGVCVGFIGNRILRVRQREATKLLVEGATPEQVDKVHVDFGMPMGPFQMADLAGVDVGWHRDPNRIETVRDQLCAMGRLGQKAGKGYYDYDDKRRPTPSGEVQQVIEDFARREGVERRQIGDEEIIERTLYPMVNEGAKILEEGIAQRAGDIDVVWAYGYGWPRYRGGPMFWGDTVGLRTVVDGLKRQEARMAPDFSFSQLLLDKAAKGERFTG